MALAGNGFADGPSTALIRYLNARGAAEVCSIRHPLVPEDGGVHDVTVWSRGVAVEQRRLTLPFAPPLSYALDLLVPRLRRHAPLDWWFGFNNLNTVRGLLHRRGDPRTRVVYYCVDFTPDRFGPDTAATRVYDRVDRHCCQSADAIWSLSAAAHAARVQRLRLDRCAPHQVVPMGAWLAEVPKVDPSAFDRQELVFLGHLIEKQGLEPVLDAVAGLAARWPKLHLTIMGRGPHEPNLRAYVQQRGLAERVVFTGFLQSHADVEARLAKAALAVATYNPAQASFSRYADPGKLKAYFGAGLPVLVTRVPPNVDELVASGCALEVPFAAEGIAQAIEQVLGDRARWQRLSHAALAYAAGFDWGGIFDRAFAALTPSTRPGP